MFLSIADSFSTTPSGTILFLLTLLHFNSNGSYIGIYSLSKTCFNHLGVPSEVLTAILLLIETSPVTINLIQKLFTGILFRSADMSLSSGVQELYKISSSSHFHSRHFLIFTKKASARISADTARIPPYLREVLACVPLSTLNLR